MRVDLRKVTCALTPPSHSKTHIQTHIHRVKGEHTIEEYTGAHASRHAHPRPGGRVASQAQFVRMEKRHIVYSSQHPPPSKGVREILFLKARPFG
jgi:hypothetical protein